MTAVPLIMFSTPQIHEAIREELKDGPKPGGGGTSDTDDSVDIAKLRLKKSFEQFNIMYNYNLKFMNSVWGLYNRYAPQAFQKNEEALPRGL